MRVWMACTQAEFDQIIGEMGVSDSLDKLDALLAAQPELPDGTRLCAPALRPRCIARR